MDLKDVEARLDAEYRKMKPNEMNLNFVQNEAEMATRRVLSRTNLGNYELHFVWPFISVTVQGEKLTFDIREM